MSLRNSPRSMPRAITRWSASIGRASSPIRSRQLRAAAELLDDDADDVRQMEPGAQDDRRDVAELVGRRLVGLLHALDPRDEDAPVLVEDRLEHLRPST